MQYMPQQTSTEYFLELDHVLELFAFIHQKYPGILYSRTYIENPLTLYQTAHQLSQKLGIVPSTGPYYKHRFSFSSGMIEKEIFEKEKIKTHLNSCFELILQLNKDFKPKGLEADLIQLLDTILLLNIRERFDLVKAFFQITPLLYDVHGDLKPVDRESALSALLTDHAIFDNQYMDLLFAHLSLKIHKILQEKNVLKTPDRSGIIFEAMIGTIKKTFKAYRTLEVSYDKSAKHTKHKRELVEVPWWLSFFGGNLRSVEDCSVRSSVFCGLIPESKMFFYQDPETKKVLGYVFVVQVTHPDCAKPIPYILTPNGKQFKAADIKGIGQAIQSIYKTDCCILINVDNTSYEHFVNFTGCTEGIKRLIQSGKPIQDLTLPHGWNDELVAEHQYFYYHPSLIQEGILVKLDSIPITSTEIDYKLPEIAPKSLPEITRNYFAALCLVNQGKEKEPNEFSVDKVALFQTLGVTPHKVEIMQMGLEHSTYFLTAREALRIKSAFGKEGLLLAFQQMNPLENLQTLYRLRSYLKFWITQENSQAFSKAEIIAWIEESHHELMTLEKDQDEYTSNELSAAYDQLQALFQLPQLNAYFLPEMVKQWSPKLPDEQKTHLLKMFKLLLCSSSEVENRLIFLERVLPCLKQAMIDVNPHIREEALTVALHYVPLDTIKLENQNHTLMLLVDSFTVNERYCDHQTSLTTLEQICPKVLGPDISQRLYDLLTHEDEITRKGALKILLSTQIEIDLDQKTQDSVGRLGQEAELQYFSAYAQTMFYGHGTPTHTALLFAMSFEGESFLQQAAERAFLKMKIEQPAILAKHLCTLSMGDPVFDPTHRIAAKAIEMMKSEGLSINFEDCLFLINALQQHQDPIPLFKVLPEENKMELATLLADFCLKTQACFSRDTDAFLALGPAAKIAIPQLVTIGYSDSITANRSVKEAVHTVLNQVDPTGQKIIISLLQLIHSGVTSVIAETAQLLCKIGPEAHTAIPALLKCMDETTERHLKHDLVAAAICIAPESKEVTHQILAQTSEHDRDSLLSPQYRQCPSTVIQTLVSIFKDKNTQNATRVYALNRLVYLAPEAIETKETVLWALSDPSEDVQKETNRLLEKVTLGLTAIPLLTAALENKNLWLGSVIALGHLGPAAESAASVAIRATTTHIDDLEEETCHAVFKALAAMNLSHSALVPFAVAQIPKHARPVIRFLQEQGSIPESAVLPIADVLSKKLDDITGYDAIFLIEALQNMGTQAHSAIPVLFSALGHSYQKVSQAAQLALKAVIPIEQLSDLLREKCKDPNPDVRYLTLQLLVEYDPLSPKTVQTLLDAVQDNFVSAHAENYIFLITALFKTGFSDRMSLLKTLAGSLNPNRTEPLILFFKKEPIACIQLLTAALSSNNPKLHILAAETVVQLGSDAKAVAPALEAALLQHSGGSCVPLLQALSKIDVPVRNTALIPLLVKGLQASGYFDEELRKLAAQTLAKVEFDLQSIAMELVNCLSTHYVTELSPLVRKIQPTQEMLSGLIKAMLQNLPCSSCLKDCIHLLDKMGNTAKPALPALVQLLCSLSDYNKDIKQSIAQMVSNLAPTQEAQVSLYVGVLQDTREEVRIRAACALSQLGAAAKVAIPQLVAAVSFPQVRLIIDIVLPDLEERVTQLVNLLIYAQNGQPYQNILFKLDEMTEIETAQPLLSSALKTIPTSVFENSLKIFPKETLKLIQLLGQKGAPFVPQIIRGLNGLDWRDETKIVAIKTLGTICPQPETVSTTLIKLLHNHHFYTPALEVLTKLELHPNCSLGLLGTSVEFLVTKMMTQNPDAVGLKFAQLLKEDEDNDARHLICSYLERTPDVQESVFIQVLPELPEQNVSQLIPAFLKTKPKEQVSIQILCKALKNLFLNTISKKGIVQTLGNMGSLDCDVLLSLHEVAINHDPSLKPPVHSLLLKALYNKNNSVLTQQAIIDRLPDYFCKLNDAETIATISRLSAILSNVPENNLVEKNAQAVLRKIIIEANNAVERLPDLVNLLSWNETQNNNHSTVCGYISEAISTIVQRDTLGILKWLIEQENKNFIKIITASEPTSETIINVLLDNNRHDPLHREYIQMAFDFMHDIQHPFSVQEALQIIQFYVDFSEKHMAILEPPITTPDSLVCKDFVFL